MSDITKRVKGYINKYDMLPLGGAVLCAVSGGADSMCMLSVLHDAGYGVVCAHFNHRLRGDESDRDERFVREYCRERGVEYFYGSGDVSDFAAQNRIGIEEAARKLRYAYLEETASELGLDRIATAHTASDNTETVLLNLVRGSGIRGLAGIPPVRGVSAELTPSGVSGELTSGRMLIIRPVLCLTRSEVEAYLSENGIPNIEDSSNAGDDYSRNRLRHHVMPELLHLNPALEKTVLGTSELLREDEEYLNGLAQSFIANSERPDLASSERSDGNGLRIDQLTGLPRPLLLRVIRSEAPFPLTKEHTEAVERLVKSPSERGLADIPGVRVVKESGMLSFGDPFDGLESTEIEETELLIGRSLYIIGANVHIDCTFIENCTDINSSFNIFYFKNDTIRGKITIRSRRGGDKLRLAGRKTRSLKKLFSEARIPLAQRSLMPVIADEGGVVGVYGFGVNEKCLPSPGDDVLKIQFRVPAGTARRL